MSTKKKVEILLSLDSIKFNRFHHFVMNKKGDLYWGPSYKVKRTDPLSSILNEKQITIQIPDNFKNKIKHSGHYSYHKSGCFHYKTDEEGNLTYDTKSLWVKLSEINKPVLFYSVISKVLKSYDSVQDKHERNTFKISIDPMFDSNRLSFEFFLSPGGSHIYPDPLQSNGSFLLMTDFKLNENLFLVIRVFLRPVIDADNHLPHDMEFIITPNILT